MLKTIKNYCASLFSNSSAPAETAQKEAESELVRCLKKVSDIVLGAVAEGENGDFRSIPQRLEAVLFLWCLAVQSAGQRSAAEAESVRRMAELMMPMLAPKHRYFPEILTERLSLYARIPDTSYAETLARLCRYADTRGPVGAAEHGFAVVLHSPPDVIAIARYTPKVKRWVENQNLPMLTAALVQSALELEKAVKEEGE